MKKLLLTALLAVLLMGGEAFAYIPVDHTTLSTAAALRIISDTAADVRSHLADSTAFLRGYADTTTATKLTGRTTGNQRVGSLTVDTGATIGDTTRTAFLRVGTATTGTFSILDSALTGYGTTPSDTVRYSVDVNNVCFYQVGGFSASSTTTGLTIGHIPAALRPTHAQTPVVWSVTNNGVARKGAFSIATTGIITVAYDSTAFLVTPTFTATGTKGVAAGISACYSRF